MTDILVPLDFSERTSSVLRVAMQQAQQASAKLWLLHVAPPEPDFVGYEPGPQTVRDQVADTLRDEHRALEDLVRDVEQAGLVAAPLMVQGPTSETILRHAERLGVSLIVMGSHGYGAIKRVLLGSVSQGVLREAKCPVLIVPPASR